MDALEKEETRIEKFIYAKAEQDSAFAIAYALLQCASAMNTLADHVADIVWKLQKEEY